MKHFVRQLLMATYSLLPLQALAEDEVVSPENFKAAFVAWIHAEEREAVCGFSFFRSVKQAELIERATEAFHEENDVAANDFVVELETAARAARNSGYTSAVLGPCQPRDLSQKVNDTEEAVLALLQAAED